MKLAASDMRAMRRALEVIFRVNEKPSELRHLFVPRDATVRLALEITLVGRAYMPGADPYCAACDESDWQKRPLCNQHPPHAWIELWGHAIEGALRGGAEMRPSARLLEEFNKQRNNGG